MSSPEELSRRSVLRAGLAVLASSAVGRADPAGQTLALTVKEEAGLQRFGYPVHAVLPLEASQDHLQLLHDGKSVPAQFGPARDRDGRPAVSLDFNVSLAPLETASYVVRYGPEVHSGPTSRGGLKLEHSGSEFQVTNAPSLSFAIPDDLLGFVRQVVNSKVEFVRQESFGLSIRYKDDIHYRVGGKGPNGVPTRATVTRQGPLAVGLRFEGVEALRGERAVQSKVDLTVPNSKSWIETRWTVEDPEGFVAGLGLDLNLRIDDRPTLVDLGAISTVYSHLLDQEQIELCAGKAPGLSDEGRRWIVRKRRQGKPTFLAIPPRPDSEGAEGWAHVMDSTRCTALAVAGFGRSARDRILVDAGGRLRLWRDFAGGGASPEKGPKGLTFWLHFVGMPVQVGAVTSPQSMLSPLRVTWD